MNNTIYLNDKNEVVPKSEATHFERYEYDNRGRVILRIYGEVDKSS
jgi:hypothetical protein